MSNFLPSPLPCRKAVETSKLISFHLLLATLCTINCRASFPRVGASPGISLVLGVGIFKT